MTHFNKGTLALKPSVITEFVLISEKFSFLSQFGLRIKKMTLLQYVNFKHLAKTVAKNWKKSMNIYITIKRCNKLNYSVTGILMRYILLRRNLLVIAIGPQFHSEKWNVNRLTVFDNSCNILLYMLTFSCECIQAAMYRLVVQSSWLCRARDVSTKKLTRKTCLFLAEAQLLAERKEISLFLEILQN